MNANLNHIHLCFLCRFFATDETLMIVHYSIIVAISEFAMNWICFNSSESLFPFAKRFSVSSFPPHFRLRQKSKTVFNYSERNCSSTDDLECVHVIHMYIYPQEASTEQKTSANDKSLWLELSFGVVCNRQRLARNGKITYSYFANPFFFP